MNLIKETIFQHLYGYQFADAFKFASNNADSFTADQYKLMIALYRRYGNEPVIDEYEKVIVENALANIGVYDDTDDTDED